MVLGVINGADLVTIWLIVAEIEWFWYSGFNDNPVWNSIGSGKRNQKNQWYDCTPNGTGSNEVKIIVNFVAAPKIKLPYGTAENAI